MRPLARIAEDLAAGRTTSEALVEDCLARIADPSGEGARAFMAVHGAAARAAAKASDAMRRHGVVPSPLAGIPISVKDLFDIAGEVTRAGSKALADAPPASADAPIVARLRAAGAVVVGRTNMTEFAYSGVGINPHYGTPAIAWDRSTGRIPGGSSSGAAVSVTDGMAAAAIGTDTGGSVRIPAAFNGLAGFKPTARRVPIAGAFPLAASLDSIGPLAPTLACCALVDAVMAGEAPEVSAPMPVAGLRLGVPETLVLDDVEPAVMTAFEAALAKLSKAGALIQRFAFPELAELPGINAKGGFAASEAWALHRDLIARKGDLYDQRVLARIRRGAEMTAADYIDLVGARAALNRRADARTLPYDAIAMPAIPVVPPPIAAFADDAFFGRTNLLILRNTSVGNFLDRCSLTVPCTPPDTAPVGFMLTGARGDDRRLLSIGQGVEAVLAG